MLMSLILALEAFMNNKIFSYLLKIFNLLYFYENFTKIKYIVKHYLQLKLKRKNKDKTNQFY